MRCTLLSFLIWMRAKRCFCVSDQTGRFIQLFLKCASPLVNLKNICLFCSYSHSLSVTPRGDLFSISQGCRKNLPKVFCTLPSIPSLSASEPLQAWLQHTVKYSMEIPSWYICKAPLNKEQKIMRSESNQATSDTAVPDLVNSFFYHYSSFAQRLCWDCSGSEASMNIITPRKYVSHLTAVCTSVQTCQQPALALKSYL